MFNALLFLDMQPTNQCVLQILCDRHWVQRHIPQQTPTCACTGQHLSLNMDADRKSTPKHSSMLSSYSFFAMLVTISNMNRVLNLSTSPANSENRKKLGQIAFCNGPVVGAITQPPVRGPQSKGQRQHSESKEGMDYSTQHALCIYTI